MVPTYCTLGPPTPSPNQPQPPYPLPIPYPSPVSLSFLTLCLLYLFLPLTSVHALGGADDSCDDHVPDGGEESVSVVESKWDNGDNCEQKLVCVVVCVPVAVSERFSGSFMDAVRFCGGKLVARGFTCSGRCVTVSTPSHASLTYTSI